MALEKVLKRSRTLSMMRNGPLEKFLDGFCIWLEERGFTHWTISLHLTRVFHLHEYLKKQRRTIRERISSQDIKGFFRSYPSWCHYHGSLENHIRRIRRRGAYRQAAFRFLAVRRGPLPEPHRPDALVLPAEELAKLRGPGRADGVAPQIG